jgi:hypothetical protein
VSHKNGKLINENEFTAFSSFSVPNFLAILKWGLLLF